MPDKEKRYKWFTPRKEWRGYIYLVPDYFPPETVDRFSLKESEEVAFHIKQDGHKYNVVDRTDPKCERWNSRSAVTYVYDSEEDAIGHIELWATRKDVVIVNPKTTLGSLTLALSSGEAWIGNGKYLHTSSGYYPIAVSAEKRSWFKYPDNSQNQYPRAYLWRELTAKEKQMAIDAWKEVEGTFVTHTKDEYDTTEDRAEENMKEDTREWDFLEDPTVEMAISGVVEGVQFASVLQAQKLVGKVSRKIAEKMLPEDQHAILDTELGAAVLALCTPLALHAIATHMSEIVPKSEFVAVVAKTAYRANIMKVSLDYGDKIGDVMLSFSEELAEMASLGMSIMQNSGPKEIAEHIDADDVQPKDMEKVGAEKDSRQEAYRKNEN